MKTPSFAFYSICFQKQSLWKQRFLHKIGARKRHRFSYGCVTQVQRDVPPMQVKYAARVSSLSSPPAVYLGTDLVPEAVISMTNGRARKAMQALPTKKICCCQATWSALFYSIFLIFAYKIVPTDLKLKTPVNDSQSCPSSNKRDRNTQLQFWLPLLDKTLGLAIFLRR